MKTTRTLLLVLAIISFGFTSYAQNGKGFSSGNSYGVINIDGYVDLLPKEHHGIIKDIRLIDREHAGVRIFRLYDEVPMHYHAKSDAYLYILNGKAEFYVADQGPVVAGKGDLLFWGKGTAHGNGKILEGPLDVLVFDAIARDPSDVIWVDPSTQKKFLGN
ncbi:cupin domain-containing protein [Dokdonia sp. Dokd-P16]|jgi:mannose-6-phosphate isomerase-like protein (cupin superfamily)|uniref:cupin domain-containing protein n=1 Tax=Dokdonia sp. Dokd-P16 TaxID=2173169 RepID=UPI000D54312D|nr:cupin domain-containing protein [Dokdonia sp. Dokd-P16]AWH74713.1 cupin domain-containing protein [Dokdonia sp. Dokd-P16]